MLKWRFKSFLNAYIGHKSELLTVASLIIHNSFTEIFSPWYNSRSHKYIAESEQLWTSFLNSMYIINDLY